MDPALKAKVCTYNGNYYAKGVEQGKVEEYGEPHVPVAVLEEAGLRILLGNDDPDKFVGSDVMIEKQPDRWLIQITPEYGGDPVALVYLMADGRVVVVPDSNLDHRLEYSDKVPENIPLVAAEEAKEEGRKGDDA